MLDPHSSTEFQREIWTSIKLSSTAAKVVKTNGYEKRIAEMLRDGHLYKDSIEYAEAMIISAALGMPVKLSDGRAICITQEQIDSLLRNQKLPPLTGLGAT
jgi:hypothetical protein